MIKQLHPRFYLFALLSFLLATAGLMAQSKPKAKKPIGCVCYRRPRI
jgi:hypothetical protein